MKTRKPRRLKTALAVQLRVEGHGVVDALLHDFSSHGFGVECDALILIGSTIGLNLPDHGWVEGTVRWSLGKRSGGWFSEDLPTNVLRRRKNRDRSPNAA